MEKMIDDDRNETFKYTYRSVQFKKKMFQVRHTLYKFKRAGGQTGSLWKKKNPFLL